MMAAAQFKKVLAICGSTRANSSNLVLLEIIKKLAADQFKVDLFDRIDRLPHFNPDLDNDQPPLEVAEYRKRIKAADGVLICTPEYAMGVPGTLKNALDWTVSSMEFSGKTVALITASLDGQKAHRSLLETLTVLEAVITKESQLVIPFIRTKINRLQGITDPFTFSEVQALILAFNTCMGQALSAY